MIRKTLSARSRGTTPNCSRHRGFSLVEVMMSVVLLAIAATLAIPSYRDMVEKRPVDMETPQVVANSFSYPDTDNWCVGAIVGETACDCIQTDSLTRVDCSVATRSFILNNAHAANLTLCSIDSRHSVPGYQACPAQEEPES